MGEDQKDENPTAGLDLKTLSEQAKKQADEIQTHSERANKVVAVIEDYYKTFDETRNKINADKENITTASAEVDQLRKSSQEHLDKIKGDLTIVQSNIDQINAGHASFLELKSKIENGETGLEAVLKTSQSIQAEMATLKQTSEQLLAQIKENVDSVAGKMKEMNAYYDETFTPTKTKLDDEKAGLIAILNSSEATRQDIIATKKQADSVYLEIKKFRDDSQEFYKKIEKLNTESEGKLEKIKGYETLSLDFKNKIGEIYKIATDSSLANSFDVRKKELEKSQGKWFWVFMVSIVLLAGAVIIILYPVLNGKITQVTSYTWYRLTMTSPLLFLVGFASLQYSKERELLERYAFKSATALALESYTALLMNTFDKTKNEAKILEFVLNSMAMIYEEPHDHVKESKFSLGLDGKLANIKAELTNKLDSKLKSFTKSTTEKTVEEKVEAEKA